MLYVRSCHRLQMAGRAKEGAASARQVADQAKASAQGNLERAKQVPAFLPAAWWWWLGSCWAVPRRGACSSMCQDGRRPSDTARSLHAKPRWFGITAPSSQAAATACSPAAPPAAPLLQAATETSADVRDNLRDTKEAALGAVHDTQERAQVGGEGPGQGPGRSCHAATGPQHQYALLAACAPKALQTSRVAVVWWARIGQPGHGMHACHIWICMREGGGLAVTSGRHLPVQPRPYVHPFLLASFAGCLVEPCMRPPARVARRVPCMAPRSGPLPRPSPWPTRRAAPPVMLRAG